MRVSMNTFNERFKIAYAKSNLSQHELAKAVGVTQPAIYKLVKGESKSFRKIPELARALNVNLEWLFSGIGDSGLDEQKFQLVGALKTGAVKVRGVAVMEANGTFKMDELSNGYLKFYSDDPNAFALKIKGDSMFPRFNSGEFVVIEPNIKPCSGDEVLVKTKDGCNMIKKLECHRNCTYRFTCVNQEHPPITLDENQVDKIMFISAIVKSTKYLDIQEI